MEKHTVIDVLRQHEPDLKSIGVKGLSLFGSVARGDAHAGSDIDVVVHLDRDFSNDGLAYFGAVEDIRERLQELFGVHVDIVTEPVRKESLRAEIERDKIIAF